MNQPQELQRLQFFDLPAFYKHFDGRYGRTPWDEKSRTLNAVFVALMNMELHTQAKKLQMLWAYGALRGNQEEVLRFFYNNLVEPEWVEEVKQHIQTIQNQ